MKKLNYDQSDCLQWVADRDPTVRNNQGNSGRHCYIVRDYLDLSEGPGVLNELLCNSDDANPVFIDLGDGTQDQDLIINSEDGKVYVNGHSIDCLAGLQYLNDGSWGVKFGQVDRRSQPKYQIIGFLHCIYDEWLELVYEKASYLGLIEDLPLYNRSIWRLFLLDYPKGKIVSENPKKVLDKGTLS